MNFLKIVQSWLQHFIMKRCISHEYCSVLSTPFLSNAQIQMIEKTLELLLHEDKKKKRKKKKSRSTFVLLELCWFWLVVLGLTAL